MDILPVMELESVPDLPQNYEPSRWALAVAAELERLWKSGRRTLLVRLSDNPSISVVGPGKAVFD